MSEPSPRDLGLPRKFVSFRDRQWEAIHDVVSAKERFIVQVQKTGAGKTLVGMGAAKYLNCRMMYLTATKGLQQQLLDDFESMGLVNLMGKANYTCSLDPNKTCADGTMGRCLYKGSSSCSWGGAKQAVLDSQFAVTNYACWMAANKYGTGLGDFDLLICDESHTLVSEICKAQQISVTDNEVTSMLRFSWPEEKSEMGPWREWARQAWMRAKMYMDNWQAKVDVTKKPTPHMVNELKHYTNLTRKLADLVLCREDQWIVDENTYGYQFDPIRPHMAAERLLFHKIPKIVLTSGTISPRLPDMLGISNGDVFYKEYVSDDEDGDKSPFAFLPVYSNATGNIIEVDRHTEKDDLLQIVRKIDEIIECWGAYKGIIHSVSFALRDFIMQNSQYAQFMITNYSGQEVTADVIRRFKAMPAPAILISPSVTTGYDFPANEARFQILPKVPYPDPRPKIEKARNGYDKHRYAYQTMQALVQAYGRADRGESDWATTYILDGHIQKFMWRNGFLAPTWFLPHYKQITSISMPPLLDKAVV